MSTPTTAAFGADLAGGDERVEPGSRADVDDVLAWPQATQRERVADAGEGLDGAIGERVDGVGLVAEPGGERAAGVEVEGAVRVDRDVAVLVAHLLAQRLGIDEQILSHRPCLRPRPPPAGRLASTPGTRRSSRRARKPLRLSSRTASSA